MDMEDLISVRGPGGMASILDLTKEIKMEPNNAALYAERSQCFRIVQQYYHAVKDADKVISLRPSWNKGYFLKGLAEFGSENYKAALETFETGLEYGSNRDMIKALQKANRAWLVNRLNNGFRTLQGFFLGCIVGALALATNDFLLSSPIIKNIYLKIFVFSIWAYFGMESGKNYSKMLEKSRDERLQAPADLFPFQRDEEDENEAAMSSVGTSTDAGDNDHIYPRTRHGRKQTGS